MNSYLLKFKTKGLKNLKDEVEISFYNDTVSVGNILKKQAPKVKGIFGGNGFGKSAIIKSIGTYVDLVRYNDYLFQSDIKTHLSALINKELREFYFTAYFAIYDENRNNVIVQILKHDVVLAIDALNDFYIKEEMISEIKGRTLNENINVIFDSKQNYKDIAQNLKEEIDHELMTYTINRLNKTSICTLAFSLLIEKQKNNLVITPSPKSIMNASLFILTSVNNIRVLVSSADAYAINALRERIFVNKCINKYMDPNKDINEKNKIVDSLINNDRDGDIVLNKDLPAYKELISRLYDFIKTFKYDLLRIAINEEPIDNNSTKCVLLFVYKNYSINVKYESAGIRRLVSLFGHLLFCKNGGALFVDELDVNISSVILSKLIEYFTVYSKGQLCFTSHSLDVMSQLKKQKHSIDFINSNGLIISWINNGNKQPDSTYRNGYVEGIPFNIDSTDFIRAFGL